MRTLEIMQSRTAYEFSHSLDPKQKYTASLALI